jgi:hypothetical protein
MCTRGNVYVEDVSSPDEAIRAVAQVYPVQSLKACVCGQRSKKFRQTYEARHICRR